MAAGRSHSPQGNHQNPLTDRPGAVLIDPKCQGFWGERGVGKWPTGLRVFWFPENISQPKTNQDQNQDPTQLVLKNFGCFWVPLPASCIPPPRPQGEGSNQHLFFNRPLESCPGGSFRKPLPQLVVASGLKEGIVRQCPTPRMTQKTPPKVVFGELCQNGRFHQRRLH